MIYSYADLRTIHLEVTERCNAACPSCARNINGGPENPHLINAELDLEAFEQIVDRPLRARLAKLYACGNYGDPALAQDLLPILESARRANPDVNLSMNTHGAARAPEWWRALAQLFRGKSSVKFSIDGLEDTNAIYRRGTRWPMIVRNLQAFTKAKGRAEWQFLVFAHNEHQIDEARALAKKLGVERFTLKRSARFLDSATGLARQRLPILNEARQLVGELRLPREPGLVNPAFETSEALARAPGGIEAHYAQTQIHCRVAQERSLYISARGLALPCCWLAGGLYPASAKTLGTQTMWRLLEPFGGADAIDARQKPLAQIVDGPVFQEIAKRWDQGRPDRLRACARVCGEGLDAFADQYIP